MKKVIMKGLALVLCAALLTGCGGYRSIIVDGLNGTTTVASEKEEKKAFKGQKLADGNKVSVEEDSDLTLALDSDKHVYAEELTKFSVEAAGKAGKDSRTVIKLEEGCVLSKIDKPLGDDESYVVDTPNASMAVRGTTFTVRVRYDDEGKCHTEVEVEEGKVRVTKKDENGALSDEQETLTEGGTVEVIGLTEAKERPNETPGVEENGESGGSSGNAPGSEPGENSEYYNGTITLAGKEYVIKNGRLSVQIASLSQEDLEKIAALNLNSLSLNHCKLTDISPLSGMTNLEYLNLDENQISDISPLGSLTNLNILVLDNNQISDISPLGSLTNLEDLSLAYNHQISDLSPLKSLTNMKHLGFSGNQISDLSPLSGMTNLTSLTLTSNQISDISPLSGLTNLKGLLLGYNQISDLSPLSGLTNLTSLYLDFNQISDISPLRSLTNLTTLEFSGNRVPDDDIAALKTALGIN